MVDLFSKYAEAVAMHNPVVAALESGWIHRHGSPITFLSDQGRNVDGSLVHEACRNWAIQKLHSSPHHPQGDGEAERCIQSFKQSLRCVLAQKQMDRAEWPRILQEVAFIHNSQSKASTGLSPNEIMFGTRLRTKIDAAIPFTDPTDYLDNDWDYDRTVCENPNIQNKAAENIEVSQDRMKKYYDQGTRLSDIGSGDLALIKDECRLDTLAPMSKGPWSVIERRGVNLHINDLNKGDTRVVHLNRCKKVGYRTSNSSIFDRDDDISGDATPCNKNPDEIATEVDEEASEDAIPDQTRPKRLRRPPDRYGDWVTEDSPTTNGGESGVKYP